MEREREREEGNEEILFRHFFTPFTKKGGEEENEKLGIKNKKIETEREED